MIFFTLRIKIRRQDQPRRPLSSECSGIKIKYIQVFSMAFYYFCHSNIYLMFKCNNVTNKRSCSIFQCYFYVNGIHEQDCLWVLKTVADQGVKHSPLQICSIHGISSLVFSVIVLLVFDLFV